VYRITSERVPFRREGSLSTAIGVDVVPRMVVSVVISKDVMY
jgi:hypothetical protein